MPTAGIVDVDPDGKTAKEGGMGSFLSTTQGRSTPGIDRCGIWETSNVKEDGYGNSRNFLLTILSQPSRWVG